MQGYGAVASCIAHVGAVPDHVYVSHNHSDHAGKLPRPHISLMSWYKVQSLCLSYTAAHAADGMRLLQSLCQLLVKQLVGLAAHMVQQKVQM